jgi:hypothetical protein
VDLESPRTAGTGAGPETAVFAATAADVVHVLSSGRELPTGRDAGVGRRLGRVLSRLWEER